jgi:hypothetical protein
MIKAGSLKLDISEREHIRVSIIIKVYYNINFKMTESNIKGLGNDIEIGSRAYQQVKTADTSKGEHEFEDLTKSPATQIKPAISPDNARFPYCIVWTPLPLISWFVPFIGHTGIGMSDGVIHDFAGPYYVGVDELAFGETHK